MRSSVLFALIAAGTASATTPDTSNSTGSNTVSATPHASYSSSVGVLGCMIDTNRVAYWPDSVDCNNICVKLSYQSRSVYLLRIDQSGGAHDVSYDAWNYLQTGESATVDPIAGGGVAMEYENVDASECASLIHTDGQKLPLSAANSMNFVASCLAQPDSWVAENYVLYNILDPLCSWGVVETCTLNLTASNQPSCPTALGVPVVLTTEPVYNIEYPSGETVLANANPTSNSSTSITSSSSDSSASGIVGANNPTVAAVFVIASAFLLVGVF